jgi:lysophospholipase L1-like esterase
VKRLTTIVSAVACVSAALVLPVGAHAAGPVPARVLIVGDSITQGQPGDATWRFHYWDAFRDNVDLVGPKQGQWSQSDLDDEVKGRYGQDFDFDHASRWGMSLSNMPWSVADLMRDYTPDVVVDQLGVNDLLYVTDAAGLIAGQRSFVAQVRAADPFTEVVLGQLSMPWFERAAEYNALLPALVAELDTPDSRVVMAEMPPMTRDDDSSDGLHPNEAGEVKIAAAHEAALLSLGVPLWTAPVVPPPTETDEPPPLPTPLPTPQPTLQAPAAPTKVKAASRGGPVKVTWRAVSGAESYGVRCGRVHDETGGLRVRLDVSSERCRVRAVNVAGASPWVSAAR